MSSGPSDCDGSDACTVIDVGAVSEPTVSEMYTCIVVPPATGGDNVTWAMRLPCTTVTLATESATACGGGELTRPMVAAMTTKMPITSATSVRRNTRGASSTPGRLVIQRLAIASASTPTITTSLT